jgi:predicted transcriptional regulator of viral defense system
MASEKKSSHLSEYLEMLQEKGRLTFTKDEARKSLKLSPLAFNRASERLIVKKRLVHPSRGFFVIVPAEHRSAGAPPVSWFIHELMKFHEQSYYAGLLTAAAFFGAAHQAPQEFQVVTSAALRPIHIGRSKIHFLTKKWTQATPIAPIRTPFGDIQVSTPEATVFDLVQYVHRAGHLSNVATILLELSEKLDPKKLVTAAQACGEITVAQRVGYLLDSFADKKLTLDLHHWLEKCHPVFTPLRPNWKPARLKNPKKDRKWQVVVNETVEPDV